MWWIREGKNIFLIYPNSFADGMAKDTLKKLARYTNYEWNETQLNCVLKEWESRHFRRKDPPKTNSFYMKSTRFIASTTNSCAQHKVLSIDIYSKKHFVWINSAIRNIKHELKERGLDTTYISRYKMENFNIHICPET